MLVLSWQLPFLHSARAGDFGLSLDAKTFTKMRDVFHIVVLIVSAREQGQARGGEAIWGYRVSLISLHPRLSIRCQLWVVKGEVDRESESVKRSDPHVGPRV